jgi:hypothetical protein
MQALFLQLEVRARALDALLGLNNERIGVRHCVEPFYGSSMRIREGLSAK